MDLLLFAVSYYIHRDIRYDGHCDDNIVKVERTLRRVALRGGQ